MKAKLKLAGCDNHRFEGQGVSRAGLSGQCRFLRGYTPREQEKAAQPRHPSGL